MIHKGLLLLNGFGGAGLMIDFGGFFGAGRAGFIA